MGLLNTIKRMFTWWDGQTLNTQLWTWRKGNRVGADAMGNVFYRNADDSRRWVIFNGEAEASKVSPDWHGWLHYTYDELPTDQPLPRRAWEEDHLPNLTGTPMAWRPKGSLAAEGVRPAATGDYESWRPE